RHHRDDRRRHPALARRALEHPRVPQARRRGARRRAPDDDPARDRRDLRRESLHLAARGARGRGRRDGAANPERAARGRVLPERARVLGHLRNRPREAPLCEGRRDRDAPGPDQSRRRALARYRRSPAERDPRSGAQRRRAADGGALPVRGARAAGARRERAVTRILLRGGRVLDPAAEHDAVGDLLLIDGRVAALGGTLRVEDALVIDAAGCWVAPGFIDLHSHLREPGQEYKENIATGGRAAAAGGFTAVACMANTHPVNDDPATTDFILDRAKHDSPVRVYPVAAATKGLEGRAMTEMAALMAAGAVAFSDDGKTIMDSGVMRRVLQYSRLVDAPVMTHAEDRTLVAGGVVNEGPVSTRLRVAGHPASG